MKRPRAPTLFLGALILVLIACGMGTCVMGYMSPLAIDDELPAVRHPADPLAAERRRRAAAESVSAAPAETHGAARLVVKVVDDQDRPVAGARITVHRQDMSGVVLPDLTSADGTVVVPSDLPARGVFAEAGDWAGGGEWLDGETVVVVRLEPKMRGRGTVVDPSGAPCAGADVSGGGGSALSTVSDEHGEFDLAGASREYLSFVRATLDGREGLARVDAWDLDAPPVRVVLPWRVRIRGRAVDARGRPALLWSGVRPYGRVTLGEDGSFELDDRKSPGRAVLKSSAPGAEWAISWDGPGPEIDLGDVLPGSAGEIRGTVVLPAGEPVGDVTLRRTDGGDDTHLLEGWHWDADGTFTLKGIGAGFHVVRVQAWFPVPAGTTAPEGARRAAWVTLPPARAGDEIRVVLDPSPVLLLRIRDEQGARLPHRSLVIRQDDDWERPRALVQDDDVCAYPLAGSRPWRVHVGAPYRATVHLDIDETAPVIERTVVLRRVP